MAQGRLRYHAIADKNYDPFTTSGDVKIQQKIRERIAMMRTYTPDPGKSILPWMPNALFYRDAYAIYMDTSNAANAASYSDLITRDVNGNMLFIPWGEKPYTQYAGDVSNPAFREMMLELIRAELGEFQGVWLDDVNQEMRTCNANGDLIAPLDRATGKAMTSVAWATYIAEYLELLRVKLPPSCMTVHNAIWTVSAGLARDRQIAACDYVYLERGFSPGSSDDPGLSGGTGQYAFSTFLRYIDHVHSLGTHVIIGEYFTRNREYAIASYFLANDGGDQIGFADQLPDDSWPSILSADLGYAIGSRSQAGSLWRRYFARGGVVVNEPGAPPMTFVLPRTMVDFDGNAHANLTLGPGEGKVLLNM